MPIAWFAPNNVPIYRKGLSPISVTDFNESSIMNSLTLEIASPIHGAGESSMTVQKHSKETLLRHGKEAITVPAGSLVFATLRITEKELVRKYKAHSFFCVAETNGLNACELSTLKNNTCANILARLESFWERFEKREAPCETVPRGLREFTLCPLSLRDASAPYSYDHAELCMYPLTVGTGDVDHVRIVYMDDANVMTVVAEFSVKGV